MKSLHMVVGIFLTKVILCAIKKFVCGGGETPTRTSLLVLVQKSRLYVIINCRRSQKRISHLSTIIKKKLKNHVNFTKLPPTPTISSTWLYIPLYFSQVAKPFVAMHLPWWRDIIRLEVSLAVVVSGSRPLGRHVGSMMITGDGEGRQGNGPPKNLEKNKLTGFEKIK